MQQNEQRDRKRIHTVIGSPDSLQAFVWKHEHWSPKVLTATATFFGLEERCADQIMISPPVTGSTAPVI